MVDEPVDQDLADQERKKIIALWTTVFAICAVIAFGSIFVTRAYLHRRGYEIENWRPPHIAKLETDLEAINRDGQRVMLSEMRDKVFVAGYQYTDCPSGCLGLASVMKDLEEEFGDDPRFHLVSLSVNPAGDTPEKMDAWVKQHGIDSEDWWFLTGDEERFAKFMLNEFKFFATEKITDPEKIKSVGEFSHDTRLALVDGDANVRGYYDVLNLQRGQWEYDRLVREIKMVLDPSLKLSDFDLEIPQGLEVEKAEGEQ